MDKISFECIECGNRIQRDVFGIGHAVKSLARKISDQKECCSDPYYIDSKGHRRIPRKSSFIERITSIRA